VSRADLDIVQQHGAVMVLSHCPGTVFADWQRRSIVNPVKTAVVHQRLADQLWQADQTAVPIPPLTDQNPDLSIEDAYAIQSVNIDRRIQNGERICGRKIGLTSQPMQELLGVDEPDYGVLLDGMFVEDGDEIDLGRLVQPRVEAEMAFIMERDLEGPGANTASALRAIAGALPAVEIVDSRVADWKIKLVDTVADNASSGLIVMGGRLRRVDELDLRLVGVAVSRGGELIDTGAGAAALGNPARCVAWLANKLASFGAKLNAGDVVLPGAVHKMVPVQPGDVFRAEFAHLGAVTVRFSQQSRSAA
jgi:2-keto-4-pentenoate hydratase